MDSVFVSAMTQQAMQHSSCHAYGKVQGTPLAARAPKRQVAAQSTQAFSRRSAPPHTKRACDSTTQVRCPTESKAAQENSCVGSGTTADIADNSIKNQLRASPFLEETSKQNAQSEKDLRGNLLAPYMHVANMKGKQIRSKLIGAFQQWLAIPEDALSVIDEAVGMLHNASLVIDDIEDQSPLRRGLPAAHVVYGTPRALNAGNLVYFMSMQKIAELGNPAAVLVMVEEMVELHVGQGSDIYWRDTQTVPSVAEYKKMVVQKTGGLFRLCVRLMQCFSKRNIDLIPLAEKLGEFFQVRDDYVNLTQSKNEKGFCEDLGEGKFSFPVIHALSVLIKSRRARLLQILQMHSEDESVKMEALALLQQARSLRYTELALQDMVSALRGSIEELGDNSPLLTIVDMLASSMPVSALSTVDATQHAG